MEKKQELKIENNFNVDDIKKNYIKQFLYQILQVKK